VNEQLLTALIAVGIILLVSFPVHECSHALAAYRLGDSTARFMGRLTLDPRVHFDPFGGGMLFLSALISGGGFFFGFAKPTPVNPTNLDGGRRGEALVALAGPLSNLVMAALVALPLRFVIINVFLFLFNLLPIPPLDGWKVLTGLVDPRTAYTLRQIEQYAILLLIVVFFFAGQILVRIASPILTLLLGQSPFR
jgi:Zn-dependent protease